MLFGGECRVFCCRECLPNVYLGAHIDFSLNKELKWASKGLCFIYFVGFGESYTIWFLISYIYQQGQSCPRIQVAMVRWEFDTDLGQNLRVIQCGNILSHWCIHVSLSLFILSKVCTVTVSQWHETKFVGIWLSPDWRQNIKGAQRILSIIRQMLVKFKALIYLRFW